MALSQSRGSLSHDKDVFDVPFTKAALKDIQELAQRQGKTMSRVIQESIAVNRWVVDNTAKGGKIVAIRDGKRYELETKS